MTRIGVTGATGRMGQTVIETIQESEDLKVAFAVDKDEAEIRDVEVRPDSELEQLLQEERPDAVVDFTAPVATLKYAEACAENNTPMVTGTTGLDEEQLEELKNHGSETPVLKASNFSQGIQALRNAIKEAVSTLPDYDVEVMETHHDQKVDAPSGTAKTIVEDIEEEKDTDQRVHGREGDQPRQEGEIGIHARRAGDIKGEHEVMLADNEEILTVKHRSESRSVFASGALKAAEWIKTRETGFYSFEEVLE